MTNEKRTESYEAGPRWNVTPGRALRFGLGSEARLKLYGLNACSSSCQRATCSGEAACQTRTV